MDRQQIITFIRTVPIFVELEGGQLEQLAGAAEVREFSADEVISEPGRETSELYIILEGELQAVLSDRHLSTETELTRLYPGDYFGVVSFFTGALSQAKVRALEPGRMLVLRRDAIDPLFETSPAFARALCRSLAANVAQSLDKVPSVPFVKLENFRHVDRATSILPKRIARHCQCVIVERDDHQAKVAMVNPHDGRARTFLANVLSGYQLEFVAVTEEDFQRYAKRMFEEKIAAIPADEPLGRLAFVNSQGRAEPIAETGAQDLLPRVLTVAIRERASDIHVEPGLPTGRVRLRIDGRLLSVEQDVPLPVIRQIISRIKVMSELNITNTRRPQDGRFVVLAGDRQIEMRAAVIPCHGGEKVVLRLTAGDSHLANLANVIVFESVQSFMEDILAQPSGLVLVTGPTGAGKTTTLYAALHHLNNADDSRNIVTIEDPIEYDLPFATQTQVNRDLELGFAEILRSVLRQDPDVILVGEMRDAESAAIAVEAASTGHLVLSTLHTHSAMETLVRLRNLQIKPYLLADALKGIISQKLVRRLAPGYTQPVPADDTQLRSLREIRVLPDGWSGSLQRGRQEEGGPQGGESGRVGVFEVLTVTDPLRELIEDAASQSEIASRLDSKSYLSFAQYSRMLLADHYVAPERILEIFPKRAIFEDGSPT
jgi:type II secretory ATPase GspE/PulE/Tfp pilus assembly ATPase PilB-like protein